MHILTTETAGELAAGGAVYRMTGRWREENWFRYGRAHYELDSLDSYAVTPDDPDRKVPNPEKKKAAAAVQAARKALAAAEDTLAAQARPAQEPGARPGDRHHERDARPAGRTRRRGP